MSAPHENPRPAAPGPADEQAVADAYDRFAATLMAAAWGLLGSRADAEDAVHDVFVSLVRSHKRLDDVRDLRAYLFAALRREAWRRWRQPRPVRDVAETDAATYAGAPGGPFGDDTDDGGRLQRALAALPPEQREVVALHVDGGLTLAETAEVLGISASTAASRYRYALEKLRDRLRDKEGDL